MQKHKLELGAAYELCENRRSLRASAVLVGVGVWACGRMYKAKVHTHKDVVQLHVPARPSSSRPNAPGCPRAWPPPRARAWHSAIRTSPVGPLQGRKIDMPKVSTIAITLNHSSVCHKPKWRAAYERGQTPEPEPLPDPR